MDFQKAQALVDAARRDCQFFCSLGLSGEELRQAVLHTIERAEGAVVAKQATEVVSGILSFASSSPSPSPSRQQAPKRRIDEIIKPKPKPEAATEGF